MYKASIYLLVSLLFLSSCTNSLYNSTEEFPNNNWKKDKIITFKVPIDDVTKPVSLTLLLRHGAHIQYSTIHMNVVTTTPKGTQKK